MSEHLQKQRVTDKSFKLIKQKQNGMIKESTSKPLANKTDWKRVDDMSDEDIQYDEDRPRTEPEDWATAVVHQGLPLPRPETS